MSGEHEVFDELAVGWALHALEPEDEAVFAAHLPGCDRCARTVAETVEVMVSLAKDVPSADPSPELRRRLRDAVGRTEQLSAPSPSARRPVVTGFPDLDDARMELPAVRRVLPLPGWRRALPAVLGSAAVAVIVGLGVWNVVLDDSRDQAQATAEAQSRILSAVLAPGQVTIARLADGGGHTVATVVARPGDLQVITQGLPVNDPADSTYVVWGIRSAAPVALGTFDVVHPQMDLQTVGSSRSGLDDFTAYGISLEPGRQAPAAPTDIVATAR